MRSLGGRAGAGISSGDDTRTYGVDVVAVTRAVDDLLAARATREDAGRMSANLTSSTMARVEAIFPEPTDLGLASQLDEFWGSWTDLANNPGDLAARTQLLEHAKTLVDSIHQGASDLEGSSHLVDRQARCGGRGSERPRQAGRQAEPGDRREPRQPRSARPARPARATSSRT